jgi:hypothetical protein
MHASDTVNPWVCPSDKLVNKPFARVEYSEAIRLLQEEIAKDKSKWQFPDVEFGTGV